MICDNVLQCMNLGKDYIKEKKIDDKNHSQE